MPRTDGRDVAVLLRLLAEEHRFQVAALRFWSVRRPDTPAPPPAASPDRHTLPVPAPHNPARSPRSRSSPNPPPLPPNTDTAGLFTSISCTVYAASRRTLPPGWRLHPTTLPHYRILVGLSGGAHVVVDGRRLSLVPGSVILIPPGATHRARPIPDTPPTLVSIEFDAKLHGVLDVSEVCGLPVSLEPTGIRRRKATACAQTIARYFTTQPPGYRFALHSQCIRLLATLHQEVASRPTPADHTGHTDSAGHTGQGSAPAPLARPSGLLRFRPVFQLVEQRFAERLTLHDLSAAVHLQPAYFSDTFKRAAGVGPHEYVYRYRLERARDLLVTSDAPLHEIARRTGFYDAAHLVRLFRRHHGTSPGVYRRSRTAPTSLAPI